MEERNEQEKEDDGKTELEAKKFQVAMKKEEECWNRRTKQSKVNLRNLDDRMFEMVEKD